MNVLAIETSCEQASIALLSGDEIVSRRLEGHANHSERILAEITGLLAEAGIPVSRLNGLAFGSGPGAFTGLRLACGVVQGLALGAGLGIVGVSSLAALALQAGAKRVFAATDARMGEIYYGTYEIHEGKLTQCAPPACCAPEVLVVPDGRWFGIGSAFSAYPDALGDAHAQRWTGLVPDAVPRAGEVARLAAVEVAGGRLLAPEDAVPLYVRDKVALTTAERLARGGRA